MTEPHKKYCPRCRNSFSCSADNIAACSCSRVTLDAHTSAAISATYPDCLCPECLLFFEKTNSSTTEKTTPFT